MTLAEHEQLGDQLKDARENLLQAITKVSSHYGKKLASLASRALKDLDQLKCELDNKVCSENPDEPDVQKIYYGFSKRWIEQQTAAKHQCDL